MALEVIREEYIQWKYGTPPALQKVYHIVKQKEEAVSKHIQQPVYAIIRYDHFQDEDVTLKNRITVKEIVLNLAEAQQEVKRLNELNNEKGAFYWWQTTRLILGDETIDETVS